MPCRNSTLLIRASGMSIPDRLNNPCRNITRRSVITKCVVHQVRNGHTVSHPTMTSQIASTTSWTTLLAVASQSGLLHHCGAECGQRGEQQQHQHRTDQPLPVRVPVQHHLFLGGEHALGITHRRTLPRFGVVLGLQMHHVAG